MLTLSPSQRAMMASQMEARRAMKLADTLQPELRAQAPDLMSAYDKDQAHGTLLDTISKCYAQGIHDEDQILNICYIRFIINADVFTNQSFAYILNNRLMHPYAKARHLILSFFAINAMRGGT
ncbi:hypothetical protein [Pyxidicoccus xibeiensis]|uniref:hypothetical protein n=1 Tax=Pyxidicoccus xibeiensis TaxID=2906759 RepID=UPI0020A821CC|nr:hypothetical protein [Pyxidicoccus xibeiensis]MCP3137835.1 hypothetical protein [Pyxidicoccus xibeiensis]